MDAETKQKILNCCDAVCDDVFDFTQDMVGRTGYFVMIPELFGAQIYSGWISVVWFKVSLYGKPEPYFVTCTADLRAFHGYDSTVGTCYGRVAENIHGNDERITIESIRHTLKTYALFIKSGYNVSQL